MAGVGGQEEGSEAPLGRCTETIGHLDGDVDSLVGNKIFLRENSLGWRASCRRCGKWGRDRLAGLHQFIINPWEERMFSSQEGPSSGPLGLEDLPASCQSHLRTQSSRMG